MTPTMTMTMTHTTGAFGAVEWDTTVPTHEWVRHPEHPAVGHFRRKRPVVRLAGGG